MTLHLPPTLQCSNSIGALPFEHDKPASKVAASTLLAFDQSDPACEGYHRLVMRDVALFISNDTSHLTISGFPTASDTAKNVFLL